MNEKKNKLTSILVALLLPILLVSCFLLGEAGLPDTSKKFAWLVTYSSGIALGAVIISQAFKGTWAQKSGLVLAYLGVEHLILFFYILCFQGVVLGKWL